MISRRQHPRDDKLLDCYFAERPGEVVDPPSAEHLSECASCRQRYAELTRLLDTIHVESDAETDAVFTAERLRLQQQHIAERLQHVGRAAHVISFPTRVGRRM